jgi:hypothetical protein
MARNILHYTGPGQTPQNYLKPIAHFLPMTRKNGQFVGRSNPEAPPNALQIKPAWLWHDSR